MRAKKNDFRITANWNQDKGWDAPEIRPYENLSLAPCTVVFHYGIEVMYTR
jgi:branched-chain amino acid aminotransferase